jgi:glycosyltransferase involved in cell wall biosynthesis
VGSFTEEERPPAFLELAAREGAQTALIPVRSAYDPRAVGRLASCLRHGGFDLLATHDYRSHAVGFAAAPRAGVPWIAFSRGFTREDLKVRLFQEVEKVIVRFARHVVAVSRAQKERLVRLRVAENRITVVHNAIDAQAVSRVPAVDLRARFGFGPGVRVVAAAGRFSPEKGQMDLIEAARRLAHRDDLVFVLLGEGPTRNACRERIRRAGLAARVLAPGFEPDVPGCLKGADLVVNPSLCEGLPNVVLEAMAVGTPVVATAVGGVPEILEDRENGRLVPPSRPEDLARVIADVLDAPDGGAAYARAALRTLEQAHSFRAQLVALSGVYRAVACGS